jgi:hypothetical protein
LPKQPADYCGPATPSSPFESPGLGFSDFARHYYRNHGCFLFLRVLRWFTSPSSPDPPMYSVKRNECSHPLGFPIRKSPDHSLLAASRGLSQLTTSFIAYLRQGIHTHALSSLTIKSTSHTQPAADLLRSQYCRKRTGPTRRCERYFFALHTCALLMPVNIQLSKIDFLRIQESGVRKICLLTPDSWLLTSLFVWWAWVESNYRPHPYQGCALPAELQARG